MLIGTRMRFIYRMVLFPVTLSDPTYPKPPHFRHFLSLVTFTWWRGEVETLNLVDRPTVASASL